MTKPIPIRFHEDVRSMVYSGKNLTHATSIDGDKHRRAARYLGRNKAKLAGAGAKLLVVGLVTGPIGLGVAAGVAIATPLLTAAWRSVRSGYATERVDAGRAAGIAITRTVAGARDGVTVEEVNDDYTGLMQDVRYLCSHGHLTQVLNAFAELDNDARALSLANIESSAIRDCDGAWKLQEHIERVHYRYDQLADAIDVIDELVTYVVLQTSGMDEGFEATRETALIRIVRLSSGNVDQALVTLNEAANSRHVFNHFFSKDYTEWIKSATGLSHSTGRGVAGTAGATALKKIGMAAGGQGVGIAGRATLAAIEGSRGAAAVASLSAPSAGLAPGLISAGAGGASAGAGVLIDVAVESLTRYLDMKNLGNARRQLDELHQTHPRLMDVLTAVDPEMVGHLRKSAKDILETCIDKLDHLITAHRELVGKLHTANAQELAEALLRRQKLRGQVAALSDIFLLFHGVTAGKAIALRNAANEIQRSRSSHVLDWLARHPARTCSGKVCYVNASKVLQQEYTDIGITLADLQARESGISWERVAQRWDNVPYHPACNGGGLRDMLEAQSKS